MTFCLYPTDLVRLELRTEDRPEGQNTRFLKRIVYSFKYSILQFLLSSIFRISLSEQKSFLDP